MKPNSKLRFVNTRFWDDAYIMNLDSIEKLLFLYLLTNPLTNLAGVYEIELKRIAFDTGIKLSKVEKIIKRFTDDNKVHYFKGHIILVNYQKNQKYTEPMYKNVTNTVQALPEEVREFYTKVINQPLNTLPIPYREVEGKSKKEIIEDVVKVELEKLPVTDYNTYLDLDLPLITFYEEFKPSNFVEETIVRTAIEKMLTKFCAITLDKSTVSSFYNLITDPDDRVSTPTAFKILYELCLDFHKLAPAKRNFRYLRKTCEFKMRDALIAAREKLAADEKKNESKDLSSNNSALPEEIGEAVSKFAINK